MRREYKILIGVGILLSIVVVIAAGLTGAQSRKRVGIAPEALLPAKKVPIIEESAIETQRTDTSPRLVIKSGSLNLVVKDIDLVTKQIISYTEERGGWVLESTVTKKDEVPTGRITVRVPVNDFETAMTYFSSLAVKVENESKGGEDVTEEYVDLESRLRNLEATETQLLKIMEKATKISEILEVQKELTTVREQIERTKGRILFLQRSAEMAKITVNLALSEELLPIPPGEKWRPKYIAKQAWKNVVTFWKGFSYLVINIAVYSLVFIPLAIVIGSIVFLIKRKNVLTRKKKV